MSDRHEKWVAVEPGTVIPAGQPYRIEWAEIQRMLDDQVLASERVCHDHDMRALALRDYDYYVDSSWRPPLDLPTEPTWGIVVSDTRLDERKPLVFLAEWFLSRTGSPLLTNHSRVGNVPTSRVLDFIPLTPDQVARIEAAQ